MFGGAPEAFDGTLEGYFRCIHPEDRTQVAHDMRQVMEARCDHQIVYRIIRRDGLVCWVEHTGRVVRDAAGGLLGMAGTCRDVTVRVAVEEAWGRRERGLQAVMDNVSVLIARVDHERRYVFANRAYHDRLGIPLSRVIGHTMEEVLGAAYETIRPYVDRALAGESVDYEEMMDYPRIGLRYVHGSYVPEFGPSGNVVGFSLSATDITERHQAALARQEAEDATRRLALIVENSHEAILSTSLKGEILSWNGGAERLFGYTAAEAVGQYIGLIQPSGGDDALTSRLERRRKSGMTEAERYDAVRVCKDGTPRSVVVAISPVRDAEGRLIEYSSIIRDVTEQKNAEQQRERLLAEALERADRDPLTGLLNHRAFHRRLEEEAARAVREGTSLAVAMMDLDNFKFFNDVYGHRTGDEVLRLVAHALQGECRPYDTLARFGGDEFAMLMPGLQENGADDLARRITACLYDHGYLPPGYDSPIPVGLSVGVAVFPDDTASRSEVLDLADSRLRLAKTGADEALVSAERLRTDLVRTVSGFSILDALVTAVDTKDRYTRCHSEDVLTYSLQIAEKTGLDEDTRRTLAIAALLHDVGKIGVPDNILRKPGSLTEEEFTAIRQHPQMGANIVGAVPGFETILDAVRHHHERWDGGGYPHGLCGAATPLLARILAVADAFSAMTTDRPYRKGMTETKALGILRDGIGTQWDPACVDAFLEARKEHAPSAAENAYISANA